VSGQQGNIATFVCSKTISRSMLDRAYAQTHVEAEKLVGAGNCRQCTYMCMCVFMHGGIRITSERLRVCISLANSFACVSSVRIRRVLCGVCRRAKLTPFDKTLV